MVKTSVLPYDVPIAVVAYALTQYLDYAVSPLSELVNIPIPLPSMVVSSSMVGSGVELQQTPRLMTAVPPSERIIPPACTVWRSGFTIFSVDISGGNDLVISESFLQAVVAIKSDTTNMLVNKGRFILCFIMKVYRFQNPM